MKRSTPILAIGILLLAFGVSAADETKKTESSEKETAASTKTEPANPQESPLVKAAREAKARRDGEKSKISITNEDIKKAGGKIIESTNKPLEPLPATSDVEKTMRDIKQAEDKRKNSKRNDLQAEVDKQQKNVDDLEKELRRIEETYYNEDDPDYREDVLAKNFEDTKSQLEAARKELAAARKALASSGGK